eukprot:2751720-Pleurochrysis_carterae.AAC.2
MLLSAAALRSAASARSAFASSALRSCKVGQNDGDSGGIGACVAVTTVVAMAAAAVGTEATLEVTSQLRPKWRAAAVLAVASGGWACSYGASERASERASESASESARARARARARSRADLTESEYKE